ncbi:lipopolysaccharide biosynthesis [Roseofilum sp. BLCC_M91]|uniref:Lipopolysaccharide biosynthesis n=1 Tax=Roseofilum halophilum BLCC-M91 TaxID=3022259 RepID=A0ABT7BIB2_9CYAN|nr:tyrosine-protein kinase domain-containing protein [Roseofilum halophilum]MDJ1178820.1 lipopolysaccharide biosynthesis [Roseofilum halophilum BLCC-M91]
MTSPLIKKYKLAFEKYWLAIPIGLMVGALGGGGFAVLQEPQGLPSYKFQAVLRITTPPVTISETGTSIQAQSQQLKENAEELLLTGEVLETVADHPKIQINPRELQKEASIRDNSRTPSLLYVSFTWDNRSQGRQITEVLVQELIQQSRRLNTSRLRSIIQTLNERLPKVVEELRKAENELEAFIRQTEFAEIKRTQLPGSITQNEQQQRQLELQIETVATQMASLQRQLGLNPDQAYASAALSADPIIQRLRGQLYELESQELLLRQTLRPDNPQMVELRRQLASSENLLTARAAEVIGGDGLAAPLRSGDQIRKDSSLDPARQAIAQELVGLQTQKETLEKELAVAKTIAAELKQEYAGLPNTQAERARLEQQVVLTKQFYDTIQAKLIDAQTAEAETVGNLNIAQPPRLADTIVPPAPLPILLLLPAGAVGGTILGAAAIFGLGMVFATAMQTVEDIQAFVSEREVQILGILPFVEEWDAFGVEVPLMLSRHSPYLDSYERFRSTLRQVEEKPKVVLVTSGDRQEGKSVTAYNLAIASARAGKRTLLIEADLRNPSNAHNLKVVPDPDSTLEPLRYYSQISDCIRLVPNIENLYIVPSFGPYEYAAAVVESAEMRLLIQDARQRFDFVVVDASALNLCNDPLILERYTDGVILVTRAGYTISDHLADKIDLLEESEDYSLLGIVINAEEMNIQPLPPPAIVETPDLNGDLESEAILNEGNGTHAFPRNGHNGHNGHNGNGKAPTPRPGEKSTKR